MATQIVVTEKAKVAKWNMNIYITLSAWLETLFQFLKKIVLQHTEIQIDSTA